MSVIDLQINKSLLDIKFEGYKLSLDPIPVLRQPVTDGVKCIELGSEDYSYVHLKMNLFLNHLFQDPWSPNNVFYVNGKQNVIWTSLGQDDRLYPSRSVWEVNADAAYEQANVTMNFPGPDWTVICNGRTLNILYTPSRAAGEPWMCYHTQNLEKNITYYLLHAVHRIVPGGQQIDCILGTVVHKSNLPDEIPSTSSSSFMAVLQWISFSCGQNIQCWITKRTRKLAGSSFPEYAAIDCNGDAVCIVAQNEFKFFFDSDGIIQNSQETAEKVPEQPKYTYIQTPEDITVFFRVPETTKKADIQVNFCSMQMEVLLQGKCVLSGNLANCIDVSGSTWILDGEKLEVILLKAEVGLMWQELVKGDKQGEELMDRSLIDEIHARLAHLTSETEATPSDRIPFNLGQLEECDLSNEPLTFQRIDGNNHQETHKINMGGHQWLFTRQIGPEELPAICLRHDVDGILWQPKNVFNEGELEHFKVEHVATFSALGYVQASKQDKKFTSCSPDFSYSAISDCARHIYMYFQPENLHSNFELRNRKTGESIAHIAKQYVISLEDCDKILGMQLSKECIFVLSKDLLYAAKVSAK